MIRWWQMFSPHSTLEGPGEHGPRDIHGSWMLHKELDPGHITMINFLLIHNGVDWVLPTARESQIRRSPGKKDCSDRPSIYLSHFADSTPRYKVITVGTMMLGRHTSFIFPRPVNLVRANSSLPGRTQTLHARVDVAHPSKKRVCCQRDNSPLPHRKIQMSILTISAPPKPDHPLSRNVHCIFHALLATSQMKSHPASRRMHQ